MKYRTIRLFFAAAAALAVSAAGCSNSSNDPNTGAGQYAAGSDGGQDGQQQQAQVPCSQAQLAGILVALNESRVSVTETASTLSKEERVRAFARQIVTSQLEATRRAQSVFSSAKIVPGESDISQQIRSSTMNEVAALMTKSTADFDRAFLAFEIIAHAQILGLLDNVLLVGAQDNNFKNELTQVRSTLSADLQNALNLQLQLTGACGSQGGAQGDAGCVTEAGAGDAGAADTGAADTGAQDAGYADGGP